ncbi:hypothetical protein TNIN_361251 [Trichonephila inaurata madagascariensis]|uniref:Uncharacterized protein n=1 Tax=Trichonephila inaurata madagascariensis TaxID=2747483 RepID=A0A8X6X4N1_9ARAC|nr:hypothetical protein TNIN_361251 [Trichonephila inaurata madagascariensis]
MTANKRSPRSRPTTEPANQPAGDPSRPVESLPKCRVSGNYNGDKWRSEKRNYSEEGGSGLTSQKSLLPPSLPATACPPTAIIHGGDAFHRVILFLI